MRLKVFQVDSFTTTLFEGNPAGVVLNADGLTENQMLKIARELNNSETAFMISSKSSDYDVEVRFFTPTKEVPICGHATIASHYVYARENRLKNCTIRQKTKAGILPVEIIEEENDLRIVMTQGKIEFGKILSQKEQEKLLSGLNIGAGEIDRELPIQIVSTGHSKVMIPIRSKETLDTLSVNDTILSELSHEIACNGYYVFTFDSQEKDVLIAGRMFAPAIGIKEDPVTGNANGPLGAYLTKYHKIKRHKEGVTFRIKQGEAIQRKGYMNVQVYASENEINLVKISGRARIAFDTMIEIP